MRAQPIDGMSRLGVSEDAEGLRPWLTLEQAQRAENAENEAVKASLRKRVAELETELSRKR